MNNLFLLLFLVIAVMYASDFAAAKGYCNRVKRSAHAENVTKTAAANVTNSQNEKEIKKIVNATETKSKADEDIATKIRSAIEKLNLGAPATIYVRHLKLNKSDPAKMHKVYRNMEKEHCTELQHPKSFFLFSPHANEELIDDDEHKNEKFVEILTGKATEGGKHHHERFGRSFYVKDNLGKKSKRNAAKQTMHNYLKMHKDTKDHRFKRAENESPIEYFLRLTKMLVDMNENMHTVEPAVHAHKTDAEIVLPNGAGIISSSGGGVERLSEVIYKPMIVDPTTGDDIAVGSNEYLSNEFNGLPQPQHAILPLDGAGYHEFTFPLISNFSPLKLLTNAIETEMSLSSLTSDKDENDSDEYEMTCPVHFKRSTENVGLKDGVKPTGGVMELCTCHLYRKKKQLL